MSPEVKSITAAFAIVFIVLAARHKWLDGVWSWLRAAPGAAAPTTPTAAPQTSGGPTAASGPLQYGPGNPIAPVIAQVANCIGAAEYAAFIKANPSTPISVGLPGRSLCLNQP